MAASIENPGLEVSSLPYKGRGDLSEKAITREMESFTLQNGLLTPARTDRHVSKFTLSSRKKNAELVAIEYALEKCQKTKETKRVWSGRSIGAKAMSMENLTPTKKGKSDKMLRISHISNNISDQDLHRLELYACKEVVRMLLLNSWRRKREETKYLRRTVDLQHGNAEKLRRQMGLMKKILEADNTKVRQAVIEIKRMKEEVQDRRRVNEDLQNEKILNQGIISELKERISELEIVWLNSRNELDMTRKDNESTLHLLAMEKEKLLNVRREKKHLRSQFMAMEIVAKKRLDEINICDMKIQDMAHAFESKGLALYAMESALEYEKRCRENSEETCHDLRTQITSNNFEVSNLKMQLSGLREEILNVHKQLEITKSRLNQWPYKINIAKIATFRYFSALTSWLAHVPSSLGQTFPWTIFPTRRTFISSKK